MMLLASSDMLCVRNTTTVSVQDVTNLGVNAKGVPMKISTMNKRRKRKHLRNKFVDFTGLREVTFKTQDEMIDYVRVNWPRIRQMFSRHGEFVCRIVWNR